MIVNVPAMIVNFHVMIVNFSVMIVNFHVMITVQLYMKLTLNNFNMHKMKVVNFENISEMLCEIKKIQWSAYTSIQSR